MNSFQGQFMSLSTLAGAFRLAGRLLFPPIGFFITFHPYCFPEAYEIEELKRPFHVAFMGLVLHVAGMFLEFFARNEISFEVLAHAPVSLGLMAMIAYIKIDYIQDDTFVGKALAILALWFFAILADLVFELYKKLPVSSRSHQE